MLSAAEVCDTEYVLKSLSDGVDIHATSEVGIMQSV